MTDTAAAVATKEFSFGFRTDKIRDDEGKVIGTGRKHPTFAAVLPVPSREDAITMLQAGGKEADLLMDALYGQIELAARAQINDWREANGLDVDFTPNAFDLSQLAISVIANTDKKDRAGAAISEEDQTAFLEDYQHVMTNVVGYDKKRVALAMSHFKVQLRRVKNDKPAVQKLLDLLTTWADKTEALEDHMAVYQDLDRRATKYLAAVEKNVAQAL
jgi:hypothetical protein